MISKQTILLNFLGKHTGEIEKVKKACDRCRDILAFVNQTVKEAEDKQVKHVVS